MQLIRIYFLFACVIGAFANLTHDNDETLPTDIQDTPKPFHPSSENGASSSNSKETTKVKGTVRGRFFVHDTKDTVQDNEFTDREIKQSQNRFRSRPLRYMGSSELANRILNKNNANKPKRKGDPKAPVGLSRFANQNR